MKYKILELLKDHGIPFEDKGAHTTKGNVNIQCPFCGEGDKSKHLGIHLESGYWNCWRNEQHRGRALPYLLAELLSVSLEEGRKLLESYSEGSISGDRLKLGFKGIIEQSIAKQTLPTSAKTSAISKGPTEIPFPKHWVRVGPGNPNTRGAYNYLIKRGISHGAMSTCPTYWTYTGKESYRVIFPVTEMGRLYFWTGRTVSKQVSLRYLSMTKGDDGFNIKDFVWPYDRASLAQPQDAWLMVNEGPMDAYKMNSLLGSRGTAVCLFGKAVSKRQLKLINQLASNYTRGIVVGLDPDASGSELRTVNHIRSCTGHQVQALRLHGGVDPGDLGEVGLAQALSRLRS